MVQGMVNRQKAHQKNCGKWDYGIVGWKRNKRPVAEPPGTESNVRQRTVRSRDAQM